MNSLKRKLNEHFKDSLQLRKDYLRLSEIDRRECEKRNAHIALHETSRQLESPQRAELYQAKQLTDQGQREKKRAGYFES